MVRRNYTRRDALRLGAGAVAATALRVPAAQAAAPPLFSLPLPDGGAHASAVWRTTAVLHAPRAFDLVGLTWRRGSALAAQVRARRRGGRWTAWLPLSALTHAPDGEAPPSGTDPAYTGAADEVQFRLRGSASGLTARFVKTTPARTVIAHAAQVLQPAIIPRSAWGADAVPPRAAPAFGVVQCAFVHHTVGTNDYAPEDSAGIVLGIARYHRDTNGWNDIGYNFLVDRYGQVFEGRGGGVDQPVIGAQAQGYNAQSTGIASLGTFTAAGQTEAGLNALAQLIGWKLSLHGVPVQGQVTLTSQGGPTNRYKSGTPVTVDRICGHRDGDQTECPGDAQYAQLPDLRTRAQSHAGPLNGITVHAASAQHGATPTTITGALRFADGSSPAGAPLGVEYMAAGSAWTPIGGTTCQPDGTWSATLTLPASGKVRAVFAGDATRPRLESAPVTVQVIPHLSLILDARRKHQGRGFRVSGTLSPTQTPVVCLLERQIAGRWRTAQRKRIPVASSGTYATTVRPKKPGLYRVSIIASGITRSKTLRSTRLA